MELKKLTDIRGAGKWSLLAVVYALLTAGYLINKWEMWYAIPYILGFASVALVLGSEKIRPLSAILAAMVGVFSMIESGYISSFLPVQISGVEPIAILCLVCFVGILAVEGMGWGGSPSDKARFIVLAVLIPWFVWSFEWFRLRIVTNSPMPIEAILQHGSIMLLSLFESVKMVGVKNKYLDPLNIILVLLGCLGAFMTVAVLGWGLGLLPL